MDKLIEDMEQKQSFPDLIGGYRITVQVKYSGPDAFRYYRDDEEEPFMSIDKPKWDTVDEVTQKLIAVVRCGDRVIECPDEEFDHIAIVCWALGVPNPEGDSPGFWSTV
jgi:hypothetical protein